jgi:hypothetical protein
VNHTNDAQAGLDEIAKRRNQVIDGAARGRHRGWDATGTITVIAAFAALDLPLSSGLQLGLFGVAMIASLVCFTRAGLRGKAVIHRSQMTGRFWVVLGGFALTAGVVALAGGWLVDRIDIPLSNTLTGVALAVLLAAGQPLYRTLMRRTTT